MDVIDWRIAQRVGELIAGTPPFGGVSVRGVEPLASDFASRVATYSGLEAPASLPPLELVDRSAWIAANLRTMRPLLGRLTKRMDEQSGLLAGTMRSASGFLMGAQVGALTGVLSQRVLGQYDLALLEDDISPRLLLLAPNLAEAAGKLEVDREELVLWVTIHEITHAVQFTGAPWLRGYLGGMISELIDGLQVSVLPSADKGGWLPRLPDTAELREMVERARAGELLRLTLGEDRWRLVERMQAAMSLIEGHAEHTMDVIGVEVLPSLERLRKAMNRRRMMNRGLPWRVLERLLGLELKMRQYETGRRFCDAVVAADGPEALARAWRGPEMLPTPQELESPQSWLARTETKALPAANSGRTRVPPVTN